MSIIKKIYYTLFGCGVTIFTVETKNAYSNLFQSYYGGLIDNKKLFYLPNGFDTELLVENNIQLKPISLKEKIIITVGRIGTYQKNTDLLLDIISNLDLKDWSVYIIGPIEENFNQKISDFYKKKFSKEKFCSVYWGHRSGNALRLL